MPELPEVETIVRAHRGKLCGRTISAVEFRWPRQAQPSPAEAAAGLIGATIVGLRRRAKFLVGELQRSGRPAGWLLIHLKMSGRLEWAAPGAAEPRHARVRFEFSAGEPLFFCDARKFGRVIYHRDLAAVDEALGVEPLGRDFTVARLAALLGQRRQRLKPFLLDQRRIAGIGNIYADEALFRARLHPLRTADSLRSADVVSLHAAIRAVLREAIRSNGTTFDWIYPEGRMQTSLRVYGRAGEPCRDCGGAIRAIRVGQRGTHFCPRCQPSPRGPRRTARAAGA